MMDCDCNIRDYFIEVWNEHYPGYLEDAQSTDPADPNVKHVQYQHGNYVFPAALQVCEVTGDLALASQLQNLIDAWISTSVEGQQYQEGNFPAGYFGWDNMWALDEMQWAVGAARVCERVRDGAVTGISDSWATTTAEWIDHNVIEKWWDGCNVEHDPLARFRYTVDAQVRGALQSDPTSNFSDKVPIWCDCGFSLRRILGVSVAFLGDYYDRWRGPDEWFHDIWQTENGTTILPDGSLVWDYKNPTVPQMADPFYPQHDTIHSNRMARCVAHEILRSGFERVPFWKATALANTVVNRLWNGMHGDRILINNYITGEQGHTYAGLGPKGWAGTEGAGWIYNGWNQLAIIDERVEDISRHLLDMVRRGTADSWTDARHSTSFGKIGLAAGILWGKYWRERWEHGRGG